MDTEVLLVRLDRDVSPSISRSLMTGLLICERGHLVRWPRFAELERPRYTSICTHTEFLDASADGFVVLDAKLYNSRSGGHEGVAGTENLPHRIHVPYPVWRTWGPYNPRVFSISDAARLTIAQLSISNPLREGTGFVRQSVTSRTIGFTPEFGPHLRGRITEIKEDYCPYCLSSALIQALNARLAETRDEPDVVQGHLVGWRMGAMTKIPEGLTARPKLLNHKFESWGCFGGAVILEDPRGIVIWADASGFEITSPDHEAVTCGEGVWYFQHPLPVKNID